MDPDSGVCYDCECFVFRSKFRILTFMLDTISVINIHAAGGIFTSLKNLSTGSISPYAPDYMYGLVLKFEDAFISKKKIIIKNKPTNMHAK